MFHHVSNKPAVKQSNCLLDENKFYEVINSFKRWDTVYNVLKKPTKKRFAITFDDGLIDVYEIAYPFLKSKNIPFTIFVITDFLDTEGYITTEQLKELASDELVTIGSHGLSHEILPSLTKTEIINEFNNSKKILEDIIKKEVDIFAYSHGQYNKETIKLSKSYRYVMSVINRPLNFITKNKNLIPRIRIDNEVFDMNINLLNRLDNN